MDLNQQLQVDQTRQGLLKEERELLLKFLDSPEYKAAQTINQKSIDDNVSTIVELKPQTLGDLFVIFDVIADTRVKLNFRQQFQDRIAEINDELKTK